jgi:hypothetical protein
MSRRGVFKVLELKADHVVVTGGISWDGTPANYRCPKEGLELAQPGDKISAEFTSDPGVLVDGVLEAGVNAALVRPAPYKAPTIATWDPNHVEDSPLLLLDGSPLSPADVDGLFRQQAKEIAALVARVSMLEIFSKTHCGHCQAILASGAFDTRRRHEPR